MGRHTSRETADEGIVGNQPMTHQMVIPIALAEPCLTFAIFSISSTCVNTHLIYSLGMGQDNDKKTTFSRMNLYFLKHCVSSIPDRGSDGGIFPMPQYGTRREATLERMPR